MTNQTNRNNGSNNATALETALEGIIKNCTNIVKFADMEKLAIGTSCEGEYVCSSENITEKLQKAKAEVERLESVISECEAAKAATEAAEKAEAEKEAKFISSLTNSEREALAYLEGIKTLAITGGEFDTLVENVLRVFKNYTKGTELSMTANLSAYAAILIKEERREVINLLETITIKLWDIQKASKKERPDTRLDGLVRILMAVQELY